MKLKSHLGIFLYVAAIISCATTPPEVPPPVEEEVESETAIVSVEAEDVASTEPDPGEAEAADDTVVVEPEPEAEEVEEVVEEEVEEVEEEPEPEPVEAPEPIVAPTLAHRPALPRTGDVVEIDVEPSGYDKVYFNFGTGVGTGVGAGSGPSSSHTYKTFGRKRVVVTVTLGNQAATASHYFPVVGTATVNLATETIQHDATGEPLIPAELTADGSFDTIVVYEYGREILRIRPRDEYIIPVPFMGTRSFTGKLLHRGLEVADIGQLSITGLNAPPSKPAYEGSRLLTVPVDKEIRFTVSSVDPNNDAVVYEAKFLPEGSTFDADTGEFVWKPTSEQRDLYLIHFTALDRPHNLKSQFSQRGIIVP